MAENVLAPGNAGAPAPRPADAKAVPAPAGANPLSLAGAPSPAGAPSEMMGHFGSMQDQASARFGKMKEAAAKVTATRKGIDQLLALGDTVTTEDAVDAASGMVAAGIPAANVAGILADMPDSPAGLQAWIQQQDQTLAQKEAQVQQALAVTRHEMGLTALRNIIGHSAEAHSARAAPLTPAPAPAGAPSDQLGV